MRPPRSRFARCFRLLLTPLEDRSVPTTGLSTSLSGGILRITDWQAADAIVVHQTTAGITLNVGANQQSFTAVSRVMLDIQNTDIVTNDVSSLKGTAAREVYVSRRDATGTKFVSNGDIAAGATSGGTTTTNPTSPPVVPPPAPAPAPTPKADWFTAAVSTPTLQTLARTDAADGTLSRADWLQLFAQVEQNGAVSVTEIHDLDDLLHPTTVKSSLTPGYAIPGAVQNLADKVVDGNSANATYLGAALGNLHSGSTATQLTDLVGKWFYGTDHPLAAASTTYRMVSGSLFQNGPSYTDITQGQIGDCYFVAALAGVAKFSPQVIQQMVTDNGDGTYTIRFYNAGVTDYVTVDRSLATTSSGAIEYAGVGGGNFSNSGNELWVALIEKAYAQINQEGWLGHGAANSYAAIDSGYSDLAIEQITGANAAWTWATNATAATLISKVATGKYAVLGSKQTNPGNGVIESHGYALIGYSAATGKFTLYNPWGSTISLTWAQIQQSFNGFWAAQ
jgi:hypothetical protein